MKLRTALNDYKRNRDSESRFPGERRSTTGRFSGVDARLVHVDRDGSLRDYSYPLCGLNGVERSRFGLATSDETVWFDDLDAVEQSYRGDTALVETVHDGGAFAVTQRDLTVGDAHVTQFDVDGDPPDDIELQLFVTFAPEAQETRVGQLRYDDAVAAYHDTEYDYVAADGGFSTIRGQVPERFEELLDPAPVETPRPPDGSRYEEDRLGGTVLATVPFEAVEDCRRATVATLLTDTDECDRVEALARVRTACADHATPEALVAAATEQTPAASVDGPVADAIVADCRVLSLLSAENGARVAGPDFDPFYAHSGGYGYTWFRDDAEIARFLLETDDALDLDLAARHRDSARLYCDTQLADGTWPHRVWPHDGSLAPGWANARLESGDGADYQADQTGSVASFLATYLRTREQRPAERDRVVETLVAALDGLDATLADDGLPVACQNAWENMTGRFVHTAATFLQAYAAIARAPLPDEVTGRATACAREVYAALDDLWAADRGVYALRLDDGALDPRLDSSSLALVAAHAEFDAVDDCAVAPGRLDRLVSHVETTLDGLARDPAAGDVRGVARYEGDDWRTRRQDEEKIWTVSTAWAANAAATLGWMLDDARRDGAAMTESARDHLESLLPGGPLCLDTGYLPEQVFDDGAPDSATPLGWPHALRLATVARLHADGALASAEASVGTADE